MEELLPEQNPNVDPENDDILRSYDTIEPDVFDIQMTKEERFWDSIPTISDFKEI